MHPVLGQDQSARLQNRVPGGDVNPYLAIAAMIAGGLYGLDHDLELGVGLTGNGHPSDFPSIPRTLREARQAFASSQIARAAFGDDVVDHYTTMADVELDAFDAAVTDWELRRSFEECENGGHDGGGGDARQAGDRPQHLSEQAAWSVWNMSADLLPSVYTRSVEAAGGVVVLLPPQVEGMAQVVSRLDGLIITGGATWIRNAMARCPIR